MKWFFCNSCGRGYHVHGDQEEVIRLMGDCINGFPCISRMCRGRLFVTVPQGHSYVTFKEIPVQDFYRAVKGFGLPSESATLKKVTQLLLEKRVVLVDGSPIGTPERTILRCLVLDDGTRLHFDSSSKGACVYHIEEPGNELPSAAALEGDSEGREEIGRGPETVTEVLKE